MAIPDFKPGEVVTAAKLRQLGDDSAYTPQLTAASATPDLGIGGTANGLVWANGQKVSIWFHLAFGSSPDAGNGEYFVSLPPGFPPTSDMPPMCAIGTCELVVGGNERVGIVSLDATNTLLRIKDTATQSSVSHTNPAAWDTGDYMAGHVSYFTDFVGGTPSTPDLSFPINQPWPIDTFVTPTVSLGAGGVEYQIRPGTDSIPDWNLALSSMNGTGGNVIRFLPGQHDGEYRVRGSKKAGGSNPSGVAGNHNIITANPGAVISGVQQGAFDLPAVTIDAADHWDIIGLTIDGAYFSGIRYMYSEGTAGSPQRCMGNTVINCEHYCFKARGWFDGDREGSAHIIFEGNVADGGTRVSAVPTLREGFYVGAGDAEWEDDTNNITIAKNLIRRVQAEAVEIKTECQDWVIEDNIVESCILAPGDGNSTPTGHITLMQANEVRPGGDVAINGVCRRNRIYNCTQESGPVRPPIQVGRGGIDVYSNIVWDCEASTAVEIVTGAGGMGTGTINVDGNTSDVTVVTNTAGYGSLTTDNNVPDQVSASFVGPTSGTADAGQGVGSGFAITDNQGTGTGAGRNDATDTAPNDPLDPGALAVVPT